MHESESESKHARRPILRRGCLKSHLACLLKDGFKVESGSDAIMLLVGGEPEPHGRAPTLDFRPA